VKKSALLMSMVLLAVAMHPFAQGEYEELAKLGA
jgi:hypothetical protein